MSVIVYSRKREKRFKSRAKTSVETETKLFLLLLDNCCHFFVRRCKMWKNIYSRISKRKLFVAAGATVALLGGPSAVSLARSYSHNCLSKPLSADEEQKVRNRFGHCF